VTTSEEEAERAVNTAALGGAVGLFVGGGLMGPLGLALGAVAGTGVALAAVPAGRGLSRDEAQRYEADVLAGRYLVAVETDRRPADEVRALLEESGAGPVRVEA
jgi:outer membrane lipoprotein SlyB